MFEYIKRFGGNRLLYYKHKGSNYAISGFPPPPLAGPNGFRGSDNTLIMTAHIAGTSILALSYVRVSPS
jgi:hypothetical protein